MIEITLTTIAAYGSFVLAEELGLSGVIATVMAGMLCGNYGAHTGMSPTTRIAAQTFWEYLAFALNSVVFLLIGLQVHLQDLLASWAIILAAFITVSLGRGLVILGVTGLLRATRQRMPLSFGVVLAWGGLRGALSMVLALSLPESFAHRSLLITMTFGVVVLSILIQGVTMSPLLRLLGIVDKGEHRAAYDRARGRLLTAQAALTEIDAMSRQRILPDGVAEQLRGDYRLRVSEVEGDIGKLHLERVELEREEAHRAKRHLLLVEKDRAIEAFHRGTIGRETYDALLSDIDGRLMQLDGFDERTEPEKDAAGSSAHES
jgi:CPA1 family monovalent cation:H+ antiporter